MVTVEIGGEVEVGGSRKMKVVTEGKVGIVEVEVEGKVER